MARPEAAPSTRHAIQGCFLVSGFSALVYQTAWTQELALVFGSAEGAVATVVAVFLLGLGAGAAVAARRVHRVARPLRAYALLEAAIAASALAAPLAIHAVGALWVAAFGGRPELPAADAGLRLVAMGLATAVLLGVPTALMGAALPLLSRHVLEREEQIGPRVGALYALNTAGAVVGALAAGFVLLPALGLGGAQLVAAALNLLVAVLAGGLARTESPHGPARDGHASDGPARDDHASATTAPAARGREAAAVLAATAGAGFVALSAEVFWFRLLRHLLAGSAQAVAILLAAFLLGIALGSAAAGSRARDRQAARRGFARAQLGVALGTALAFPLLDAAAGLGAGPVARAALALAVLLPSTLCMGAAFPLAVRWLARSLADAPGATARVSAWNTLGAVAGATLTGHLLLPALGFGGVLRVLVLASLALCALAWTAGPPLARLRGAAQAGPGIARAGLLARRVGGAALLALLMSGAALLSLSPPHDLLRHEPVTGSLRPGPQLFHAVGRTTSVGVFRRGSRYELVAGGLTQSLVDGPNTAPDPHAVERWLGALGALARPEARSLLLVGLGGGVTLETVPAHIERIDVVEIEPEVLVANRLLAAHRRRDPLADPRVHVTLNDARAALALSARRFDVVVSQPSRPWVAGSSATYTREFAARVRAHLGEAGVLAQWMGTNFVDADSFATLLATLRAEFAYVRVYRPGWRTGLVLLATNAPFEMRASAARAIARDPETALRLGILGPDDLEAALILDTAAVDRLVGDARPNRERHDRLGPQAARQVRAVARGAPPYEPLALLDEAGAGPAWLAALARHRRTGALARLAMTLPEPAERSRARALLAGLRGAARAEPDRVTTPGGVALLEQLRALATATPDRAAVARLSERVAALPWAAPERPALERHLAAAWLACDAPERALAHLDVAEFASGAGPHDALLRARAAARLGDAPVAVESSERVLTWLEGARHPAERRAALAALGPVLERLAVWDADAARPLRERMDRLARVRTPGTSPTDGD